MNYNTAGVGPVRIWHAGTGRPLVFLHGFEHHPGAAAFLHRLAIDRRVFAPEHPGYGDSGGFEALRDMSDLVLHYRAIIEQLGEASGGAIDLVGHSLGGMFAAEIAVFCRDLVRKLVLVDSYGLWLDDSPMPDPFTIGSELLRRAKWADPEQWCGREPSDYGSDGDIPEAIYKQQNLGAASKFMWPIPDRGLARRLPHVRAKTLIVHGRQDGLVPLAYAKAFQSMIPNAQLAVIDDAGHLPMIEAEDRFVHVVQSFLNA